MNEKALKKTADAIREGEEIVIFSHVLPDGDCLGSALGLGLALRELGKKVWLVNSDPVPGLYQFLPGWETFRSSLDGVGSRPTVIAVDCSDPRRVGDTFSPYLTTSSGIINIDHHVSNEQFGAVNFVVPEASSTGELVYRLLQELNAAITPGVATALYTAVVTDTGSFQYENVRPATLKIAAELMECGADLRAIRKNLWETKSLLSVRLLGRALNDLSFAASGRIAWLKVSYQLQRELGATDDDIEGLINYPRSIEGVEIGLLFRELKPGVVKVGLRSKTWADVNLLAARFGGGGHPRAAGCVVEGELEKVIAQVVSAAQETLTGRG